MKVWIVFECWDYEGEDVKGVYASEEAANKAADELADDSIRHRSIRVRMYDVKEFANG